jgi:3-isopropylmalate dehydrogenase
VRPEQGILKLRKELGTFGNLRPCFFASDSLIDASPIKADRVRGVNFTIIRELTGGIYFGERKEDEGDGKAMDTEPYSVEEIERVVRLAGSLACVEDPPLPVWSLDKANVLATSRLWRKTFERIMKDEYPHLKCGTHLIDSAAMLMIKDPRALNGVVVTSNLFGDIISDEASVIPGSLGLLPSASLGGIPDGKTKLNGIYEPIHGKYFCTSLHLRLLTTNRLRARYCRQRRRQSCRNCPIPQHDVQILFVSTRACTKDRRGHQDNH